MCGITGMAGSVDRTTLEQMTDLIAHRGPDDSGIYISPDGKVGLGNRRLSIIDLSPAGHMPMSNEDGTVWVTYNGEIYNFPDLRTDLERQGHVFRSHSDTEVLIHGYEEWGLKILDRIDGMFAFALWDENERLLLLARDHFGIKPLYYSFADGRLVFGSEVKSILCADGAGGDIDPEVLHRYLAFLWVPGPETMFPRIEKLPPGHYMTWREGRHEIRSYWDLRFDVDDGSSERALSENLLAVLRRSVERHLISDVPLGVFLSGGLDSTAILALATEISAGPVTCYTIAFRPEDSKLEQSADDPKFARMAAEHFGADYHEIMVSPDIVSLLPKAVWHLDEPVADPAAIATYLISEAARPDVRVLLSGQGADEIFAGYRLYLAQRLATAASRVPQPLRGEWVQALLGLLPRVKDRVPGVRPGLVLAAHRYLDRLLRGAGLTPEKRHVFNHSYYDDDAQRSLYTDDMRSALANAVAGDRHLAYFDAVPHDDFVNQMLYVDAKTFLAELNLTYCDKLSMAASVEVRVPFLDGELVELMERVPPELKLKGFKSKYILRRALDGIVPEPVLARRKAGFGAPIRTWLRRDLREMVDDLLSEETIRRRGYFNPKPIRQLIDDDRNGVEDNTYRIWALLTLEIWHRTFVDQVLGV